MTTTVIVPVHSGHGHSSDVPWPWIVGYIAIALVFWVVASVLVVRHESAKEAARPRPRQLDGEDKAMHVAVAGAAATLWPLALVGYGIWRLVQRLTEPRVDLDKKN